MSPNVKSTNLRFNLDKDIQRKAWDYLQSMDKQKFKSYSHVIALSLVEYFDRYICCYISVAVVPTVKKQHQTMPDTAN